MKEEKRQRITQCLEQLDAWRVSGLTMREYVQSIGQSLRQWRTWLSTESRWRSMLLRKSTAATAGFVQVHGPQDTEDTEGSEGTARTECTQGSAGQKQAAQPTTPPASHLLLEVSRTGSPVRINVQWPLNASAQSVAWVREVLS